MDVKYPTPWRPLLRDAVKTPKEFIEHDKIKTSSTVGSFVLFVRLPTWKKRDGENKKDSSNSGRLSVPEIRTLRNITNGTPISAIKVILELSCGIPAHIINLVDVKDNILDDNTKLELGKNINNAGTLSIKILPQWDAIVKSAWVGDNKELLAVIPKLNKYQGQSWNDLKMNGDFSLREDVFCALFVASARGNAQICETILKSDFDPNQNSILGNTAVHCASFHGQIEVLKLLVAYGTNIRVRNIKNQSALDIAVSCGFIDCARWLWLNQWSISITRTQPPQHVDSIPKPKPTKQKNIDSKDIAQSTPAKKFFQKSNQDFLLEKSWQKINKEHKPIRPSSSINRTKLYNDVKARQRPKSSIHYERNIIKKRNEFSPIPIPKLPPQVNRVPTRSIPSKYNSRMQTIENARTDFHFQVKQSEQEKRRSQLLQQSLQLKHQLSRTSTPAPVSPVKINRASEIYSKSQQNLTKTTKINLQPDNHHLNHLYSSIASLNKPIDQTKPVSRPATPLRSVTPSVLKPTYIKDQYNSEYIDVIQEISPSKKKSPSPALFNESNGIRSTDRRENLKSKSSEFFNYIPPKTAPVRKRVVREKSKQSTDLESFQKAQKERFEEIRRQKNENAFNEWMAAKQRQRKSKEIQHDEETYHYGVKLKWGKTFEDWLAAKNNQQQFKDEVAHQDISPKRNKSFKNGMTFEEWMKEKRERDKISEKKVENQEQADTELKYLRERKFSIWVEKKNEELRNERRKSRLLQQEKLSDMTDYYETWKSQKRVLSFEEWRKGKENEKRLEEISIAQRELGEDLDVWMEMNRKMKADAAFHKWLLRKESLSLEQAERELEDAKHLRARAERKAKLKRAFRKAKMMLKWRQLQTGDDDKTALSDLIHRIKHQRVDSSSSESNPEDNLQLSDEMKTEDSRVVVDITHHISVVDSFKVVGETNNDNDDRGKVSNSDEVGANIEEPIVVMENTVNSSYIETQHLHGVNTESTTEENKSPGETNSPPKTPKKKRRPRSVKKRNAKKSPRGNSKDSSNTTVQVKQLDRKSSHEVPSIIEKLNQKIENVKQEIENEKKKLKSPNFSKNVEISNGSRIDDIAKESILDDKSQEHKHVEKDSLDFFTNKAEGNDDRPITRDGKEKKSKLIIDIPNMSNDGNVTTQEDEMKNKPAVKPVAKPTELKINQTIHAKGNIFNQNKNPYSQVLTPEKSKVIYSKAAKVGVNTNKNMKTKKVKKEDNSSTKKEVDATENMVDNNSKEPEEIENRVKGNASDNNSGDIKPSSVIAQNNLSSIKPRIFAHEKEDLNSGENVMKMSFRDTDIHSTNNLEEVQSNYSPKSNLEMETKPPALVVKIPIINGDMKSDLKMTDG